MTTLPDEDPVAKLQRALVLVSILLVAMSAVAVLALSPREFRAGLADIARFVTGVAWPAVVLIMFTVMRGPIRDFLAEIGEVTWGGASVKRGDLEAKDLREKTRNVREEPGAEEGPASGPAPNQDADSTPAETEAPPPTSTDSSVSTTEPPVRPPFHSKNHARRAAHLARRSLREMVNDDLDPISSVRAAYDALNTIYTSVAELPGNADRFSVWRQLQNAFPPEVFNLMEELGLSRNRVIHGEVRMSREGAKAYVEASNNLADRLMAHYA